MKESRLTRCLRVANCLQKLGAKIVQDIDDGRDGPEVRALIDPNDVRKGGQFEVTAVNGLPMIAKQTGDRTFTGSKEMLRHRRHDGRVRVLVFVDE